MFSGLSQTAQTRARGFPPGPLAIWMADSASLRGHARHLLRGWHRQGNRGELGWSWMAGAALRDQIAVDALRKELLGSSAQPLAFTLYDQIWLFSLAGTGTLLLELGAPFALFHKTLSTLWVFGAFSMHWGILLVMGIEFRYQLSGLVFLSFFEIERAVAAVQSKAAAAQSMVVARIRGVESFHPPPPAG